MGWGEPLQPRPHPSGGIVIEVAAAEHLAAVEAERDELRQALTGLERTKAEAENVRLRAYAVASRAWDDAMRSTSMTAAEKDRVCVAWRTARMEADRG